MGTGSWAWWSSTSCGTGSAITWWGLGGLGGDGGFQKGVVGWGLGREVMEVGGVLWGFGGGGLWGVGRSHGRWGGAAGGIVGFWGC